VFIDCSIQINSILEHAKTLDDVFQSYITEPQPSSPSPSAAATTTTTTTTTVSTATATATSVQDRQLASLRREIGALEGEIQEKDTLIGTYANKTKDWKHKFGALVKENEETMDAALIM
jgi:hypothetical protein